MRMSLGGEHVNLIEVQPRLAEEWSALTVTEKDEIIQEFESTLNNGPVVKRPTARSQIQDVCNVRQNIQALVL